MYIIHIESKDLKLKERQFYSKFSIGPFHKKDEEALTVANTLRRVLLASDEFILAPLALFIDNRKLLLSSSPEDKFLEEYFLVESLPGVEESLPEILNNFSTLALRYVNKKNNSIKTDFLKKKENQNPYFQNEESFTLGSFLNIKEVFNWNNKQLNNKQLNNKQLKNSELKEIKNCLLDYSLETPFIKKLKEYKNKNQSKNSKLDLNFEMFYNDNDENNVEENVVNSKENNFYISSKEKSILRNYSRTILEKGDSEIFLGYIDVKGPCKIKGKDLLLPNDIECVQKEKVLMTVNHGESVQLKCIIGKKLFLNKFFDSISYNLLSDISTNIHRIHKIESSVKFVEKVNYVIDDIFHLDTKDLELYKYTNEQYQWISMEIFTNGSYTPLEALKISLKKSSQLFLHFISEDDYEFLFKDI